MNVEKRIHVALISLYVIENSGVRILAAVLRKHGFKVTEVYFKDWINNRIAWPTETELRNLSRLLIERRVDLVGFSVRASAFIDIATFMTERVRKDVAVPIIWGGIHSTPVPEGCIQTADMVCIGECEDALLEFVQKFSRDVRQLPTDVPNTWVRIGTQVFKNDVAPLRSDLDSLPFKDYHSQQDKFYLDGRKVVPGDPGKDDRMYLMIAGRGCIYGACSFCINTMLNKVYPSGYRYRRRSVKNVIDELIYAKKHLKKLKRIRFDDEIFPLDAAWVNEFCREYKEKIDLPFECHLHPVYYNEDHLRKLKAVGLDSVAMGVEANERIGHSLFNRCESPDDVLKAAQVLHRLQLKACYQVIMDDPVSTEEDRRELFALLMKLPRPFELYLFSLTLYPGTALSEKLLKEKIVAPDDIEGRNKKVFSQFRVDLAYPRPDRETFWIAMLVLLSKDFVPKRLLWKLSTSKAARKHLGLLVAAAQAAHLAKMSTIALEMLVKGEMSAALLRRWLNFHSLITQ